ncbi:hypothetical protein [Embleya sp. NPDC020630]|uniref:hypothetical protein n=1 Tax=Embleya sp. NPDC020630 TaxID=3363979 RepID=UPI0037B9C9D7
MLPAHPETAPPDSRYVAGTTTAVVTITTADGTVTPAYLTVPAGGGPTALAHTVPVPYEITPTRSAAPARTAVPQWALGLAVGGIGLGTAVAGIGYGIGAAAPGIAAGADLLWALAAALGAVAVLALLLVTRRPQRS